MEYLNKLSPEELTMVLNKCGLFVVDDIKKIIKETQKENGDCYYIRAIDFGKNEHENATKNGFYRLIKNSQKSGAKSAKSKIVTEYLETLEEIKNTLPLGSYNSSLIDMYTVSDFMIYRIVVPDNPFEKFPSKRDCDLHKKFYLAMCEIYKDEGYSENYKKFVANLDRQEVME